MKERERMSPLKAELVEKSSLPTSRVITKRPLSVCRILEALLVRLPSAVTEIC